MADLAELGLRIDGTQIVRANEALDDFAEVSARADQASQKLTRSSGEATRVHRDRAEALARETALTRERAAEEERIAEDVRLATQAMAEGQLSANDYADALAYARREAEALGVSASGELGRSISQAEIALAGAALEAQKTAESMRDVDAAVAGAAAELTGMAPATSAVEELGSASIRSAAGAGRLNQSLASLLRQATGTHPVVGQLTNVIGSMAVGTALMTGVLAGLAAVGLAWRELSEDAREARRSQDEARESLERLIELRRIEALGPGGAIREDVDVERGRMEALARQIEAERALQAAGGAGAEGSFQRIQRLEAEYAESAEIVRKGEEAVAEAEAEGTRERERSLAAGLERLYEERRRREEEAQREIEAGVQAHRERLVALSVGAAVGVLNPSEVAEVRDRWAELNREIDAGITTLTRRNEADTEQKALAQAILDIYADELTPVLESIPSIESVFQTRDAADAIGSDLIPALSNAGDEGENAGRRFSDSFLAAVNAIGAGVGGLGRDISSIIVGAGLGGRGDEGDKFNYADAALGAAIPALGLLSGLIGPGRDWEAELSDATGRWESALDRFADILSDSTRFERLREGADALADEASNALLESIFPFLRDKHGGGLGGIQGDAGIAFGANQAFQEGGIDAVIAFLEQFPVLAKEFGDDWEALSVQWAAAQARIEEARQKEIAGFEENLELRTLRILGLDEEADAMERVIGKAEDLAKLDELFPDGIPPDLIAGVDAYWQAVEDSGEAAKIAAEALRAFNAELLGYNYDERVANLEGDDFGAAYARAEEKRARDRARAQSQFDAGIIEDPDELQAWFDLFDREFDAAIGRATDAMRDAAQAAIELAEAAAFKEMQDLRNLDLQIARALGNDQEALDLQQLIQLDDAIHEGRSQEYLDKLALLHAIQDQHLAQQLAARSANDLASSFERQRRESENLLSVRNSPTGFSALGARHQSLTSGASFTVNGGITVVAQPGADAVATTDQILAELNRRFAAGGLPLTFPGAN